MNAEEYWAAIEPRFKPVIRKIMKPVVIEAFNRGCEEGIVAACGIAETQRAERESRPVKRGAT